MRGHVKQRGSTWAFWADAGRDENGKRKQITKGGFTTKREAERALNAVIGRLNEGSYIEPTKLTVAAFMRQWLDAIRATVRPSTIRTYRILTETHIVPRIGRLQLQRLTPAHLDALYSDLLLNGRRRGGGELSPRTARAVHLTIHKALRYAVDKDMLPRNVADKATPPGQRGSQDQRTWSATELTDFLNFAQDTRDYTAYYVAAFTGMRRGEVLGLRWRDCDLDRGTLSVSQTLIMGDHTAVFGEPKTGAGRRRIALDAGTADILRSHRVRQTEERTALGLPWPTADSLVFTTIEGQPLRPTSFSARFERLVAAVGVPRIRFHDLRHTHATLLLLAGTHPKVVQERLGHASITMTLEIYSHVIPAMQEEAAAKFASLVAGGSR
jgi:integrase